MRKTLLALSFLTAAGGFVASGASASQLIYEPFDYPSGTAIAGNGGWVEAGTAGTAVHSVGPGSLTAPSGFPASMGNSAVLKAADNTEFDRLNIPNAFNPDLSPKYGVNSTLYYSVLLQVSDLTGLTTVHTNANANNDGIVMFNNVQGAGSKPSNWGGELVIRLGSAAGTYNLGVRASDTPANTTFWTGDITANTDTHLIVVRYVQDSDPVDAGTSGDANDLWLDPSSASFAAPEGSVPGPNGTTFGSINKASPGTNNFAASIMIGAGVAAGSNPNSLTIDELRVGTTWNDVTSVPEPASLSLLALGAAALVARRRRA